MATFELDVRNRSGFERVADDVEAELGPVSVLCNNAGVGSGLGLAEMTYAQWDLVNGVNLGGVINGIQTFLPRMVDRGGPGHVVNTSSGAGLAVMAGTEFMYHTAKYAVVGMSEALRMLLAPHGIGLTVLASIPPDQLCRAPLKMRWARSSAWSTFSAMLCRSTKA